MSTTKPMKDTIYIDVDDEITSIIEKVEGAKNKIVALVLPKRAASLQSIVNMRLLKRASEKAGKNVVLITGEQSLLPIAGAVGIHVARSLQSKPAVPPAPNAYVQASPDEPETADEELDEAANLDYAKPIGELAAASELDDSPIDLDDEDEPRASKTATPAVKKNKKLKVPNFEKFRLMLVLGAVGLVGLIVFAIFAMFVLPKSQITIKTASMPVAAHFNLTTSDTATELDEEKGIIPAAVKKADQESTQQVPATGQKNNGNKASGKVTLSLTDCSKDQVTVPAGAGVTSGGMTFILQKSASLESVKVGNQCRNSDFPSFSKKTVDVVAQTAGAKYNIGPSAFTVAGYSNVTGSSSDSMIGGTDEIVTVVSQQDVETAKQKVTSADSDNFSKTFQKQLEDTGFYVLTSTLKLSDPATTTSPEVGQPASNVTVSVKITYTVLVVPKADLEKAVASKLTGQIDEKRQKLSLDNVLDGLSITVQNQTSPAKATLAVSQETTAVPIIDAATIKAQAGGKKRSEIERLVKQYPGVESVSVKFSPFWVSKAPSKPDKVIIKTEEVKTSNESGS